MLTGKEYVGPLKENVERYKPLPPPLLNGAFNISFLGRKYMQYSLLVNVIRMNIV